MILFKRNAKGDPISWSIHEWGQDNEYIVHYGVVGGVTFFLRFFELWRFGQKMTIN